MMTDRLEQVRHFYDLMSELHDRLGIEPADVREANRRRDDAVHGTVDRNDVDALIQLVVKLHSAVMRSTPGAGMS